MRDPMIHLWTWYHSAYDDKCPCGGRLILPTDHRSLRQCVMCGMIGRTERLTRRATDEFYISGRYRRWLHDTRELPADAIARGKRRGGLILAYLATHGVNVIGQSVVEMGCGAGGILLAMREAGAARIGGFELDPTCVWHARNAGISINDAATDHEYNIAILSHVLEHTFDPVECLYYALSWLSSGSFLYIEYPIYRPTMDVGPHHNWYFSRATLHVLCNKLNLMPIDTTTPGQAFLRWGPPDV